MSSDTAAALAITAGVCSGLIGLLTGGLYAWWVCANTIRSLSVENHALRRQLLARGGATVKPQSTGGRLIRSDRHPGNE
jgi:hypothetical protein